MGTVTQSSGVPSGCPWAVAAREDWKLLSHFGLTASAGLGDLQKNLEDWD